MKPGEFDDLIRQKFDQNDFEYNPRNWDQLAEAMDGRSKKRSIALWWWMPMAGVAASVALAMGVSSLWRQQEAGNGGMAEMKRTINYQPIMRQPAGQNAVQYAAAQPVAGPVQHKKEGRPVAQVAAVTAHFGILLENALPTAVAKTENKPVQLTAVPAAGPQKKEVVKELAAATPAVHTFVAQEVKKEPKTSVILSGGVTRGNQNNGYEAGATIRRMLNDKVYVEGEIGFASSNNSQASLMENPAGPTYASAKHTQASKVTATESNKTTSATPVMPPPIAYTANYNLSYALVSPSIGVKVLKKMSIAAGPDFQQALADNRPASAANLTRENVQVMPLFDIGLVGKTEYALTRNVKAAVSYRKGINNVITPMDKYIDRDYLQVQVRYSIFKK